jgi:hypothetical protein
MTEIGARSWPNAISSGESGLKPFHFLGGIFKARYALDNSQSSNDILTPTMDKG